MLATHSSDKNRQQIAGFNCASDACEQVFVCVFVFVYVCLCVCVCLVDLVFVCLHLCVCILERFSKDTL